MSLFIINCQTKVRINHLTAVKSVAILSNNTNLKFYTSKKTPVILIFVDLTNLMQINAFPWLCSFFLFLYFFFGFELNSKSWIYRQTLKLLIIIHNKQICVCHLLTFIVVMIISLSAGFVISRAATPCPY